MSKELFISASPHETKVAVCEDDQLVEVYYQRDTDVGLVGGIYKGRVSRVLPGMQSAFVDVGLERDAFLYVSDYFLEDQEEYEKVFEETEARVARGSAEGSAAPVAPESASQNGSPLEAASSPAAVAHESSAMETAHVAPVETPPAAPEAVHTGSAPSNVPPRPAPPRPQSPPADYRRPEYRGRRRRRRGRGYQQERFDPRRNFSSSSSGEPRPFEVLPGESLAKYGRAGSESATTLGSGEVSPEAEPARVVPFSETEENSIPTDVTQAASEGRSHPLGTAGTEEAVDEDDTETPPTPESPLSASVDGSLSDDVNENGLTHEVGHAPETASSIDPPQALPGSLEEPRVTPSDHESTAPVALPDASQVEAQREAAISERPDQAPSEEASGAPVPRTYTYREPQQRPRFAPHRRRGRGMGHRRQSAEGRRESGRPGNHQPRPISELLKEGQEILVQIAKEPLGTKGARITSHIALPGRYVVYMPTISHIGVSRKIASEEERLRLRNIIMDNRGPLTGGFIVRTAGGGRSEEELKADLKFLGTLWTEIRAKAERSKPPALIHRDLDLVQRILRDTLSPDFKSVRVDNEADYERALDFVNRCQPSLVGAVKLYTRAAPLFDEFGIQAEIERALKPKVWLKSGGYIVINQTEALVAIDVNTGKYVGKTNRLEDTILKTNIDAVKEIVRQIRLRDLGGIIVIDFIDMDERRNRMKVAQALEEALRRDRAPTKIVAFNEFGLVAITRKRVKQSLERTLCEPCSYCTGAGWIKSAITVCNEILAEVRKMAKQMEGDVMTLRVNPEVAHALKSHDGKLLSELEAITHKDVLVKSDPAVHQERFEIF